MGDWSLPGASRWSAALASIGVPKPTIARAAAPTATPVLSLCLLIQVLPFAVVVSFGCARGPRAGELVQSPWRACAGSRGSSASLRWSPALLSLHIAVEPARRRSVTAGTRGVLRRLRRCGLSEQL